MVVPPNTTSLATVRRPSLSRRAVLVAALSILAAVVIALAMINRPSTGTAPEATGAGSPAALIHYRGLGEAPATTARATAPSPSTISRARAEHSYGLVP